MRHGPSRCWNPPTQRHTILSQNTWVSTTYPIYRVLQELKETLESLVFTLWKVFVFILIQLIFSVLDTFHVVTVPFQRIPETCRKTAPVLVEGTVFRIEV